MTGSDTNWERRRVLSALLAGAMVVGGEAPAGEFPKREPFLTDVWLDGLSNRYRRTEAGVPKPARALFLGNSITLNHDVPAKVSRLATEAGTNMEIAMAAASGARLRDTAQIGGLERLLREGAWDVLVLQDYTTTPLRASDRQASARTMVRLAEIAKPRRVVLYPPWPRATQHRFYAQPDADLDFRPRDPAEFVRATMTFYDGVARENGFTVAPVPEVWMQAVAEGQPVYDADNYHASETGAALAARVIWDRLERVLSELG